MPEQHPERATWRQRHDEAKQRQDEAQRALAEATRDRALALMEGIAELGGPPPDYRGGAAAVARVLKITPQAVSQILKAYRDSDTQPRAADIPAGAADDHPRQPPSQHDAHG